MPWKDHVHAVQAETILRYLHPADSDWKLVLDTMLLQDGQGNDLFSAGRGVLMTPMINTLSV